MKQGLIIVVSGPAGCGKKTVLTHLTKTGEYILSVSLTTRDPRPGEIAGVDYNYVTREYFQSKIDANDMMEYTDYCGNLYGTPKSESYAILNSGKHLILELEVEGAMNIKKKYPDSILIMLLPPSHAVEEQRLRGRATETEESIVKRLARAKVEITYAPKYDYVVYNYDNMDKEAADKIKDIVSAEESAMSRHPNVITDFLGN